MPTGGFIGKGSKLEWEGTEVKYLTRINTDLGTVDDVDFTNHNSPDDYEEFAPGIIRVGLIDIEGNLDFSDPGQVALYTALQNKTVGTVLITCSDAGAATMGAEMYVKSFKPQLPVGKATFTASLRPQEKVTVTP